jgi:hypothetical protein
MHCYCKCSVAKKVTKILQHASNVYLWLPLSTGGDPLYDPFSDVSLAERSPYVCFSSLFIAPLIQAISNFADM